MGCSPSGIVVPASGPAVMATVRALDRLRLFAGFAAAAGRAGAGARPGPVAGARPGALLRPDVLLRPPAKSERTATTTARISPHIRTRTTARSRKRAAGMGEGSVLAVLVDEDGGAHLDPVTGGEPAPRRGHVVDSHAVGGAGVDEHDGLAFQPQLGMPAGNARIVEPQVGVDPAADDGDRVGEEEHLLLAARLRGVACCLTAGGEHQSRMTRECADRTARGIAAARSGAGVGDDAFLDQVAGRDAAADPEDAGVELPDLLEPDLYRPDEGVALLVRVLTDHGGELLAQRAFVRRKAAVVGAAELDDVVVGDEDTTLGHDGFPVVRFTLKCARDLNRLHLAFEHLGEGALDETSESSLEALQDSHEDVPSPGRDDRIQRVWSRSGC